MLIVLVMLREVSEEVVAHAGEKPLQFMQTLYCSVTALPLRRERGCTLKY